MICLGLGEKGKKKSASMYLIATSQMMRFALSQSSTPADSQYSACKQPQGAICMAYRLMLRKCITGKASEP